MSREQDFISEARQAAAEIWRGQQKLKALKAEATAQDYGNTLPDGEGANTGYTRAEVFAVVNTTSDAMEALFAQGHSTNLTSLL